MSERKAVIKNADMSEDMQQDAVDCASQALEKYNIEKASNFLNALCTLNMLIPSQAASRAGVTQTHPTCGEASGFARGYCCIYPEGRERTCIHLIGGCLVLNLTRLAPGGRVSVREVLHAPLAPCIRQSPS